jgi:alkylhydroperoxidase/carboxymuconolactone decarboxylase family protein YurZ
MPDDDRRRRGLETWDQMLGPERAEQTRQLWRDICPDFEEIVVGFLGGEIWGRPQLDRRTKSLVSVSALAALGRPLALELNLHMAIRNGATRQEIVETLLQIAPYAGFPATWEALTAARKVFGETENGPA